MLEPQPKFGVAGFPPNFHRSEFKKRRQRIFEWLFSLGLDWIELQNTYGIKMGKDQAVEYKNLADQYGIGISMHAPYFITLASGDQGVVRRSQERIKQAFELSDALGCTRIIFHPGHFPGSTTEDRRAGITRLIANLREIRADLPLEKGIHLYPEIAGKINQLGSLDEIFEICTNIDFTRPCLDLAHLHAREGGSLTTTEGIVTVFDKVEKELGRDRLQDCHIHMYPVGLDRTGEKGHRAFTDMESNDQLDLFGVNEKALYHPQVQPFINAIKQKEISPIIICEAKDTQDEGARMMKSYYQNSLLQDLPLAS